MKNLKNLKNLKNIKNLLWEIESIQFIQYIRVHVENHFNLWLDVVTDIVGSKEFIQMVEYSEDTYELTGNITPINKLHRIFVNNDALKSVFHAQPSELSSMYKDEEYKKVANKFCEALNKTFAFMMLQSPPCHIVFAEKDSKIDGMNKLYTKSGTHVNYVVWPALLIHENGALLSKGVVQPHDS